MNPTVSENASMGNPSQDISRSVGSRMIAVLGDIKIAHTVFALPFALLAAHFAFVETGGYRTFTLLIILFCMLTARTAAMSFNRWLDRDLDAANPRTQNRSIPSGRARPVDALAITILCSILFIIACWFLGPLPLALGVPTIAFLLTYSWSKRFTALTHLWLGAALAIAPTGAWIAVTGSWSWTPVPLSFAVMFWVAGFDIIYSLQDIEFDRAKGVRSIPAMIGTTGALWIARGMHIMSFAAFAAFGYLGMAGISGWLVFGWPYWAALGIVGFLLIIEHSIVKPDDRSRIGIAFFTMNGVISILLYLSVIISTVIGSLYRQG